MTFLYWPAAEAFFTCTFLVSGIHEINVRVRVNHKYFGIPSVYTYPCYILHCYYYYLYFTNRGTRVWCVNFLDQLYWYTGCPPIWLNISGCICEGVCKRLAEWMNWVRQMVGIIQSLKAWIEWRSGILLNFLSAWLAEPEHWFSPGLYAPDCQAFRLGLESSALWFSDLQTTLPAFLGLYLTDGRL